MKTTTVQEIMTTRVIWVKKDATFRDMATALREHPVSAFPVVDDGTAIGVVSEPGVISGIVHYRDQVKARGVTAADLMTTAVVAVRDRLDYPPPERPADRYDMLACFPMD